MLEIILDCCKKKKRPYELDIFDLEDYNTPIIRNMKNPPRRKCGTYAYKSTVMTLLIVQMLIFVGLSWLGKIVYFETNDMIPPIKRIVSQTDAEIPSIVRVIDQINASLPDITMMVDHAPEIVRIIRQTNESLPQIVRIINGLDLDLPRINSIINALEMFDTKDNVDKIQKIIDKIPVIIRVIDFVYANIPHIAFI